MEEQMPELVDDSENEDSSTRVNQQLQPLTTFGQVWLNNIGATAENLGQSIMSHLRLTMKILGTHLQTHMYF